MAVRIFPIVTLSCLFLVFLRQDSTAGAFRILGICPSASYSHQQPFQALMKALAARGHSVTMLSTIPLKKPIDNYEDIDLSFSYRKNDCTGLRHMDAFTILRKNMREANELCEEQLFSPAIEELISRNRSFDAVIIEQLWFQPYYSLVKHYNWPVLIGFLSVGNLPYAMDSVGNPDDPIMNPDMAFPFTNEMTMSQRIWNVLYTGWTRMYYRYWHLPRAQQIAERRAPGTSVYDIDRNFSLVILGNNHVFGYPKPLLPNVIEIHSLQIAEKLEPLPKEIQEFLDNAEDGAIYFSLGSNLQTHQLPRAPLNALCKALSLLRQRVLWKDSGDKVPIYSSNIKFVKWAPQQAVLAHPKVMAYVMQGGLQSLQEAVHYSVPVVAIPFFGDQLFNARKILDAGIGLTLDIDAITEESVALTLRQIVQNKTYRENIEMMSQIVRHELVKPIERAVWNVEHVIKFAGSSHLKYHGHEMSSFDYYATLIVLAFIFILILSVSFLILWLFTKVMLKYNLGSLRNKLVRFIKSKYD